MTAGLCRQAEIAHVINRHGDNRTAPGRTGSTNTEFAVAGTKHGAPVQFSRVRISLP